MILSFVDCAKNEPFILPPALSVFFSAAAPATRHYHIVVGWYGC
jgi:hypothetical protein